MIFNRCPDCGSSLDPGEKCDCKEKEPPHANENGSNPDTEELLCNSTISHTKSKCKLNLLRTIRISKSIPAAEIIELIRKIYPKYDKTVQSKCEHGDEYGVDLRKDAMDALISEYAPELIEKIKYERNGRHRLTCRISCRLEDKEYDELIKKMKRDGFDQMQAFLTYMVRQYLKEEVINGRVL